MKNREIILWTVIIAMIGEAILYISLNNNQSSLTVKNNNPLINQTPTTTSSANNSNVISSYTLSDLAKHNNQSSCWTAIDGKIYDITSFISSHPAGVRKILQGCGIDATNMFRRVGAHDVSRLSNTFVGIVK